jgi:hypothetical protein
VPLEELGEFKNSVTSSGIEPACPMYSLYSVEIVTALTMKSTTFWDVTPCPPKKFTHVSEELSTSIFTVEE